MKEEFGDIAVITIGESLIITPQELGIAAFLQTAFTSLTVRYNIFMALALMIMVLCTII